MRPYVLAIGSCLSLAALSGLEIAAQRSPVSTVRTPSPRRWSAPRTPDGQPDLQGVWANTTVTPFERPQELAGRAFLTDEELSALKERAVRLFDGQGDTAPGDELFLAAPLHE